MVDMYSKWFMMVDKKPNIYRVYYNDQENSKAFKGKRKIFDGLQQINYHSIPVPYGFFFNQTLMFFIFHFLNILILTFTLEKIYTNIY